MKYLTFLKLVDILTAPHRGEYYTLLAQAISSDKTKEMYIARCVNENLRETNPTIRYQLLEHDTPSFTFKKATYLYY